MPSLTIGCLYPMHGRARRFGQDSMVVAQMAADEIDAAGGVLGRPIRLLFSDDRSDPTEAVGLAMRYIRDDLVDFVMGVVSSAVALAVSEVCRQSGTIFVGTDHAVAASRWRASSATTSGSFDHQLVRDYAVGIRERNGAFPPATHLLGQWTVVEGRRISPDEDQVLKRRRAAR